MAAEIRARLKARRDVDARLNDWKYAPEITKPIDVDSDDAAAALAIRQAELALERKMKELATAESKLAEHTKKKEEAAAAAVAAMESERSKRKKEEEEEKKMTAAELLAAKLKSRLAALAVDAENDDGESEWDPDNTAVETAAAVAAAARNEAERKTKEAARVEAERAAEKAEQENQARKLRIAQAKAALGVELDRLHAQRGPEAEKKDPRPSPPDIPFAPNNNNNNGSSSSSSPPPPPHPPPDAPPLTPPDEDPFIDADVVSTATDAHLTESDSGDDEITRDPVPHPFDYVHDDYIISRFEERHDAYMVKLNALLAAYERKWKGGSRVQEEQLEQFRRLVHAEQNVTLGMVSLYPHHHRAPPPRTRGSSSSGGMLVLVALCACAC